MTPDAPPDATTDATTGATVLVGDIGGTNVRFALARTVGARLASSRVTVSDIWKRPGADFESFAAAIAAYRQTVSAKLDGAAFGVAGPVEAGRARLLHRDWFVDGPEAAGQLGVARAVVVNDFVAMARSAPELDAAALKEIAPGRPDPLGSIAVGGPGTGFGLAILRRFVPRDAGASGGWVVVGGEGGHQLFAPRTELEWRLAENLRAATGPLDRNLPDRDGPDATGRGKPYVSNEIVAAGAGFEATLAALADAMGLDRAALSQAEVETRAAQGDPLSLEMCRLRARTVMAALGDAALSANTTAGVFIAGGVAVKLERYLREPAALACFHQRGPRTELLSRIPIRLVVSEEAPLLGAAHLWLDDRARGWL
jgi:glucokinase